MGIILVREGNSEEWIVSGYLRGDLGGRVLGGKQVELFHAILQDIPPEYGNEQENLIDAYQPI